ncbi:MAG: PPOX class probable FMN-dependent enzyme [Bermanella sp.]|jgi:PPOX class probable FMN-dependent enzyme|uniref:pyridoxamine 5'-phosphate oxidase n=1 Tax=Glaciecola sp. 33A TaxID=2057807 RepID=UPI000C34423B|nr:pyridoxamine 5'-phosphate oxidase [Glaciecola sp. 33A]PKI00338.1 pyridoxamine 5'-phosphate oxidase [Glaciecola sp. 33A]
MSDFKFPSWRQRLVRSLHINRSQPQSKYFQVASISVDGLPKNRTMVFRGFIPDSLNLISVTDIRSEKVSDWLSTTPKKFEICWYFAGSREQYRIAGHVSLVSNDTLKDENGAHSKRQSAFFSEKFLHQQWANLSRGAQEQFLWPSPKAPFDSKVDEADIQTKETNNESQVNNSANSNKAESAFDINDHFCVVIFTPLSVDYLNLKGSPQLRCLSDFENDWLEAVVNA